MIKIKCFMVVIFLTLINTVSAFANDLVSKNLCESDGVTVSFFNGVDDAFDKLKIIEQYSINTDVRRKTYDKFEGTLAKSETLPDTPSKQAGGDTKQPEQKPIKNISEAIKRLEELGEIPKLNKDKDVAGPDENGNGVRDDLDAYVASLPDTEIQKSAMLQMFAALRYGLLVDVEDQKEVELGVSKSMDAVSCMFDRYGPEIADKKIKIIRSYAINTRARFEANNRFSVAKDGTDVESKNDGYCDE